MNATTTTKTTVAKLPAELKKAIRESARNDRRGCRVIVINDPAYKFTAWNTTWDGGSINEHFVYQFGCDSLAFMEGVRDSKPVPFFQGNAVVVSSVYCGEHCDPVVFVLASDIFAFFGVQVPAQLDPENFDPAIACDFLEESADDMKPRAAKKTREAAIAIRQFLGLVGLVIS